ncbi:hypothetical protein HRI_003447700 [Hibiscus trionum]|uniref:Reverse transcriptase domain-containing protein n=1 Tax=Hibiscus trionum TaxID=183268 RepID=A0A9W7IJF7_HIBTR|nr:hypothetical protein HRI_003447700 [Hibiscus trionum]
MKCVTSSSLQVQWNGEYSPEFRPMRGIRHGDPLSPHLFNLTMKRLAHIISHKVATKEWTTFRLARNDTPISHLFYADDLVLYVKATLVNASVIESSLDLFGACSGHMVNRHKTKVFFSPNTCPDIRHSICAHLGYQEINDISYRYIS